MILKRALPLLKDDLEIEETELYLDRLLRQEGFEPLFNRKDLYGWKGLVADPVQRARMSPEELRTAQLKADEDMRQHWRVMAGELVFDGKGHSLCTVKDYCDFELFVDWKIEPGGDSGLYLRARPRFRSGIRPNGQKGRADFITTRKIQTNLSSQPTTRSAAGILSTSRWSASGSPSTLTVGWWWITWLWKTTGNVISPFTAAAR